MKKLLTASRLANKLISAHNSLSVKYKQMTGVQEKLNQGGCGCSEVDGITWRIRSCKYNNKTGSRRTLLLRHVWDELINGNSVDMKAWVAVQLNSKYDYNVK